ncbi:MAG TPA: ATP-binding protein, partial [Ramlibacter sp.]|nr:ATP-binding protein [Ramlibacter sp.]
RFALHSANDSKQVFLVEDNGAGFDPQWAHKLFSPFSRLHSKDEFDGNGMGLAIVQKVLQLHGGRVWAESAPQRGATFFFALPTPCRT